jgi:hypothetical protein
MGNERRVAAHSAEGRETVLLDGDNGGLQAGGHGLSGSLRLLDKDGRTGLMMDGGGSSFVAGGFGADGDIVLKDHQGAVVFHLDGGSANLDVGGRGHNADLRLKNASGDITLHLDAENGDLRVRGKAVSLGADHVFSPDHPLATLAELRTFVTSHHHLPGVAPAAEMAQQGVGLADLTLKLLEKVEELTLHVLALDARVAELERR